MQIDNSCLISNKNNNMLCTSALSAVKLNSLVVAVIMAATIASPASAQNAKAPVKTKLPTVTVEADSTKKEGDYKPGDMSSPKYTAPLLDTPQSITVVPSSVIQDRGATSLRDVMRNVTGISMSAGEGGVPNGDNINIRGFSARTDMFIDGVRDIGGYNRDPFNLEQLEVVKGPSSVNSGRGSTGGSINQVSKTAKTENFKAGSLALGTDMTKRATVDVNQNLGDGKAIRLNAMVHDGEIAGRDEAVTNSRWAFSPTISLGMGSENRLTLSYMHQTEDNMPDYGIPYLNGKPVAVDRENFYGLKSRDYEDINADTATAVFEHDFDDSRTLRNTTRAGTNERNSIVTAPRNPSFATNTLDRTAKYRDTRDTILINQTDVTSKFNTVSVKHTFVTGVELSQESSRSNAATITNGTQANLLNPNPNQANTSTITFGAETKADATTAAVYAFDTAELTEKWELTGGLRFDRFDAKAKSSAGTELSQMDNMLSWRGGVVYKPAENGSIYTSYGNSFNPTAEALTISTANNGLDPEESRSYEVGTKWEVLKKKLSIASALFRTEKTNARTSAGGGAVTVNEGEQYVQGFEFGATGQITDVWQVFGGYTYMDSKVESSRVAAEVGKEVGHIPNHTFTVWSTYNITPKFEVGGGAIYSGKQYSNNSSTNEIPSYWRFDSMVGYQLTKNVSVRLNGYNLTDEEYFDGVGGGHVVPGAGRSALLTTNFKF